MPTPFRLWVLGADGKPVGLCRSDGPAGLSLAGDLLGISGCSGTPGVSVRDLSRPGSPPVRLAGDGGPVLLAGTYAAWRTSTGFEILDRATGTQTAVSLEHSPLPAAVAGFDLGPDGELAVYGDIPEPYAQPLEPPTNPYVAWASPADPRWHVVAVPRLLRAGLRVRAGRIAVLARSPAGAVQLQLVDRAGQQASAAAGDAAGFDFDGTSVAFAGHVCDGLVVKVERVDQAAGLPVTDGCPVVVDPAGARVPGRIAKLGVHCPVPSRPRATDVCEGTIRAAGIGAGPFRVPAGTNRYARLRLTERAARTLARRHRLRVTVTVRSVTRGHVSRSTARVVLRAR